MFSWMSMQGLATPGVYQMPKSLELSTPGPSSLPLKTACPRLLIIGE